MSQPIEVVPYQPEWAKHFEGECARIENALGFNLDGGVLDELAHIGSTAVPGLAAKPCIDIMARVEKVPLADEQVQALAELGYIHHGEHGLPGRHYFTRGPHEAHLHVVDFRTEHWGRHIVLRDYLRHHAQARKAYGKLKLQLAEVHRDDREAYARGKHDFIQGLEHKAFNWHVETTGFGPVDDVASELNELEVPWFIASGWALDLFLDAPQRYHDDLDITIWYEDQAILANYLTERGWTLHMVVKDGKYEVWDGTALEPPFHQIHARKDGRFLDILLTPRTETDWLYRRDETITLPLAEATTVSRGLPHLAPEVILLFKSATSGKAPREKDQEDFERILPKLSDEGRGWLHQTLKGLNPEHVWLEPLARK